MTGSIIKHFQGRKGRSCKRHNAQLSKHKNGRCRFEAHLGDKQENSKGHRESIHKTNCTCNKTTKI